MTSYVRCTHCDDDDNDDIIIYGYKIAYLRLVYTCVSRAAHKRTNTSDTHTHTQYKARHT